MDPALKKNVKKLDVRDEAVLSFANSLLKRALSETFVGVSLTEDSISNAGIIGIRIVIGKVFRF